MTIEREGYPFIFGLIIPGLVLVTLFVIYGWLISLIAGIILVVLGLFCAAFFRNPYRDIPVEKGVLVSPADGRVIQVIDTDDDIVGQARRVDIFLSVFDVHVNRVPIEGQVYEVSYRPGKFLSAFKAKASIENERNDIIIDIGTGHIRVAQIAGLIARRIICYLNPGDTVRRGQLYGMIRFGSRTEITMPRDFAPCVKPGDHVKGGSTIIGIRS